MLDKSMEIQISRRFGASKEAVFAEWLDADALKDWFTPEKHTGISADVDPRVGGLWHVTYQSTDGTIIREHGRYRELVPSERLVMTLSQSGSFKGPETTVFVTLEAADGGTLMHFRQTGFTNVAHRDGNADGWHGCFDKLATRTHIA